MMSYYIKRNGERAYRKMGKIVPLEDGSGYTFDPPATLGNGDVLKVKGDQFRNLSGEEIKIKKA
jgi:hypothetical protein